jgi:hypothetical protein
MIIQFPNGAGIESSIIASIHVTRSERISGGIERGAAIQVYTMRGGDDLFNMFGSHFMSIPMPDDLTAENECRRLVAKWAGLPEPKPLEPVVVGIDSARTSAAEPK